MYPQFDGAVLCCVVLETEGWMKTFIVGLICGLALVGIVDVTSPQYLLVRI